MLNKSKFQIGFQNKIVQNMLYFVLFLIIIHLLGQISHYAFNVSSKTAWIKFVNLDKESNLPTVYQFLTMAFSGVLLGSIAYIKMKKNAAYKYNWLIMAIVFIYLAFDELRGIHEKLSNPIKDLLKLTDYFYFAWVLAGIAFALIFLIINIKFLFHLEPGVRNKFIIAGSLYVFGAAGLEIVGGHHYFLYGKNNVTYAVITTFEETFEMLGIVFFVDVLIDYFRNEILATDLTGYNNFVQKLAHILS